MEPREVQEQGPHDAGHNAVRFSLGEELFALPIDDVLEVQEALEVTPLPSAPGFLAGVTNVHGRLASVIRLADILGIKGVRESGGYLVLLVPEKGGMALLVDSSRGFARYSTLEEVVADGDREGSSMIFEGVFRSQERLVSLINPDKLRLWIDRELLKGDD